MRDRFTQEEMNEILLRAVEQQPLEREVTRAEMESLAEEIGVSLDALRAAEAGWHADRLREKLGANLSRQRDPEDLDLFHRWRQEHNRAVMRFAANLSLFMFFAALTFIFSLEEGDDALPFLLVLFPWSLWLMFKGSTVFGSGGIMNMKAFRKWQQARRMNDRLDPDELPAHGPRRLVR